MNIMLDAGHGFDTAGKRTPDGLMHEYEFTREVAAYAKSFLANYQGVAVYLAHSDSEDVPLQQRTNKANSLPADVYVSIHANAYGSNWSEAEGIETYVYVTKPQEALELANKIQKNIVIATGLKDRGVKTADFHVLRETTMTAVLIECGFMTNHREAALLKSDDYRRACAEAIVKGLAEQYRLTLKNHTVAKAEHTTTKPEPKGLYKVQVGAYKNKKNAEEVAEKLKQLGYSTYIYFSNE